MDNNNGFVLSADESYLVSRLINLLLKQQELNIEYYCQAYNIKVSQEVIDSLRMKLNSIK